MEYHNKKAKTMSSTKRMVFIAVLVSQAIVLGYFERIIPIQLLVPIPGVKLGLANIITLISIYLLTFRESFLIVILRILLSAILFSGFASFWYSLSGGILSFIVMWIFVKTFKDKISTIGVSIMGGVSHNIGQLLMASFILDNIKIFYYLPILLMSGVVTGILVGLTVMMLMKYLVRII